MSELDAAIAEAEGSQCAGESTTQTILDFFDGMEPAFDEIGTWGDVGNDVVLHLTGIMSSTTGMWRFTTADIDTARLHSLMHVNDLRAWAAERIYRSVAVDLGIDADGDPRVESPERFVAWWDGRDVDFVDGTSIQSPAVTMLRNRQDSLVVDESYLPEAWSRIDAIVGPLADALDPDGAAVPWHAVTVLEDRPWDRLVPILCVTVATEWKLASSAFEAAPSESSPVFSREIAAQELLLAMEYLDTIATYLDQPDIDWYRAPDVDETQQPGDGTTSASEFVTLWQHAAQDAIQRHTHWRERYPVPQT